MKHRLLLAVVLATAAAALIGAGAASAGDHAARNAVFVQANQASGNQIVVYDRAGDGTLTRAGTYATGGDGGAATPGTESDHLASQGSLVYDSEHRVLLAVNAGSDTVSAFEVKGDRLTLESVVPSGGDFPASIAVHGRLVYVLDAGDAGVVKGFRLVGHSLRPIPGSARS